MNVAVSPTITKIHRAEAYGADPDGGVWGEQAIATEGTDWQWGVWQKRHVGNKGCTGTAKDDAERKTWVTDLEENIKGGINKDSRWATYVKCGRLHVVSCCMRQKEHCCL